MRVSEVLMGLSGAMGGFGLGQWILGLKVAPAFEVAVVAMLLFIAGRVESLGEK